MTARETTTRAANAPGTAPPGAVVRTDLLALTPDTLAALANRGLVKRAGKDIDAGRAPSVTVTGDGGVRAEFADATVAELPPGAGLGNGSCGCGAPGVCRHLIGLVLAYQRTAAAAGAVGRADATAPDGRQDAAPGPREWSPGAFGDEVLTTAVGKPAVTAARRTLRHGYTARIHRPAAGSGSEEGLSRGPWAELPACTVRFPVPGEIGYALTDASAALRGEMVALAVWAFRAADETGVAEGLVEVAARREPAVPAAAGPAAAVPETTGPGAAGRKATGPGPAGREAAGPEAAGPGAVGPGTAGPGRDPGGDGVPGRPGRAGSGAEPAKPPAPGTGAPPPSLADALSLADDLLLDGAAHAGPVLAGTVRRAAKSLASASLHWPAAAAGELADQLAAYTARDAAHDPARFAALLAELHARHRAFRAAPGVLGEREAAETPLRRVRLTAIGCRLTGSSEQPAAQVFFAHADAGVVVVLHKSWQQSANSAPAGRRLLGTTLASLASGHVVSETARRSASRALILTRGRLAATTVTPLGGSAWAELPDTLLVRDLAAHTASWEGRPPRLVRPRVEAETVRVVELSAVKDVGYDPAAQRLQATVRDAAGHEALLSAPYNPLAPAGLDALAAALESGPTHVSGALHRHGGRLRITPYALAGPGGVTVPQLASGEASGLPPLLAPSPPDPLAGALEEALSALADAAHQGLRHLTRPARTALAAAADGLSRTGLAACATALRALVEALAHPESASARWVDTQIRLLATAELLERG